MGVLRVLTEGDRKHAQPSWSPDGRKVVYVVNDTTVESTDIATGAVVVDTEPTGTSSTVTRPYQTPWG